MLQCNRYPGLDANEIIRLTSAIGQVRPLAMHLSVGKTQYFPARLFLLTNGSCWPGSGSEVINLLAEYRPFNSITEHTTSRN